MCQGTQAAAAAHCLQLSHLLPDLAANDDFHSVLPFDFQSLLPFHFCDDTCSDSCACHWQPRPRFSGANWAQAASRQPAHQSIQLLSAGCHPSTQRIPTHDPCHIGHEQCDQCGECSLQCRPFHGSRHGTRLECQCPCQAHLCTLATSAPPCGTGPEPRVYSPETSLHAWSQL